MDELMPTSVQRYADGFEVRVDLRTRFRDRIIDPLFVAHLALLPVVWSVGMCLTVLGVFEVDPGWCGMGAMLQVAAFFGLPALHLTACLQRTAPLFVDQRNGWVVLDGYHLMLQGLRIRRDDDHLFLDDHEVVVRRQATWLEDALRDAAREACWPPRPPDGDTSTHRDKEAAPPES